MTTNQKKGAGAVSTLGHHLAAIRNERGFSLRQVEELSNGLVSNAYLSQIETGRVRHPSPNILHSLAEVYKADYEQLMKMAGYIGTLSKKGSHSIRMATLASLNVSEAEEMELVEYLRFRRTVKGKL